MRFRRAQLAIFGLLAASLAPSRAEAWDPSTTHLGMIDRAAVHSGLHVQWMDDSDLSRGLFTSLRLDPARLTPEQRRLVTLAFREAHAASGALGLGGPGACPGAAAPPATRIACVEGDLWEMTALGWMRLGVLVELLPRARLLEHFVDLEEPTAATWSDRRMPRRALRAMYRRNGGAFAETASGSAFAGRSRSALARLSDEQDPWSLTATREHLRLAVFSVTGDERDHHLALAMMGIGALLHVVQDLSVPAHARGDVTAFFSPLSDIPGDRGLPLQELARVVFGRGQLPEPLPLGLRSRPGDDPSETRPPLLATSLEGHLLGEGEWEGLVHFTGRRFFSETTLPPARAISPDTTPSQAAQILLGESPLLDPVELAGSRLQPWPSEDGYLVSGRGRMLAAFDTDERGRIRPYLDRRVLRSQAMMLIPKAIEVSASVLGLVLPPFPAVGIDAGTAVLEIEAPAHLREPVLIVFSENAAGDRNLVRRVRLQPGRTNRVAGLAPPEPDDDARVVLALEGRAPDGGLVVVERVLPRRVAEPPPGAIPAPRPDPRPREPTPPTEPTEPAPAEPAPAELEPTPVPEAAVPTRPPGTVPEEN